MTQNLIRNPKPLSTSYTPETVVDREKEQQKILGRIRNGSSFQNVHIHGSPGVGKTLLSKKVLNEVASDQTTCYVSCLQADTQYKALKEILEQLTEDEVATGHHTSELYRQLEDQAGRVRTVVVLDELDFLLQNDGDDLLYALSRLDAELAVVTVSSNLSGLSSQLEERTLSTLQPQTIGVEPYTGEEIYRIISERARKSLYPRSVHREALTYIASTTQNAALGLTWLRIAAEEADEVISETLVQELEEEAQEAYVEKKLSALTLHHKILYQCLKEMTENGMEITTGSLYDRYQKFCANPLSSRRVSDYIKHLEILQIIESKYYYGGKKGKTREMRLDDTVK